MREETKDFIARELLIVGALLLASLVAAAVVAIEFRLPVETIFLGLVFLRWILWAGRRAIGRPEQHPYVRQLPRLAAAGLILIDLLVLVHGFREGGPMLGHLVIAFPLGTLAAFLLYEDMRRRGGERAA